MNELNGKYFMFWAGSGSTTPIGFTKGINWKTTPDKLEYKNRNGKGILLGDDTWGFDLDGDVVFDVVTGYTNTLGLLKMYKAKAVDINFEYGETDENGDVDDSKPYISGVVKLTDFAINAPFDGVVTWSAKFDGQNDWTLNE